MSAFSLSNEEMVECRICGHKNHSLFGHLRDDHQMTPAQYQEQYPNAEIVSEFGKSVMKRAKQNMSTGDAPVMQDQLAQAEANKQAVIDAQPAPAATPVSSVSETSVDSGEAFGVFFGAKRDATKPIKAYSGYTRNDGVPDIDPNYVFQSEVTRNFLMATMKGGYAYLLGPTGSGKTTLPEQFAARTGRPFFRQQFHQEMEPAELMGTWTVVEGGHMVYLYSGLAEALQKPSVIVLDEYDSGNPAVTAIANALLESKPLIIANKGGERIYPHPDCQLYATGNTNGMGDETGLYTSTTVQSFATMNRFKMFLPVNYLRPEDESAVLKKRFAGADVPEKSRMPDKVIEDIVSVANLIREAFTSNRMSAVMSTRQVINWAEWLQMCGKPRNAFELSFANQLGMTDKGVAMELYQRRFGDK